MRTGMEPFFEFMATLRYALTQMRIEWGNWKQYRENA